VGSAFFGRLPSDESAHPDSIVTDFAGLRFFDVDIREASGKLLLNAFRIFAIRERSDLDEVALAQRRTPGGCGQHFHPHAACPWTDHTEDASSACG
jgi:hypothetical protein